LTVGKKQLAKNKSLRKIIVNCTLPIANFLAYIIEMTQITI